MRGLTARIKVWFSSLASEKLLAEQKILLVSMGLYFCAVSVTGIFVNLYIFAHGSGLSAAQTATQSLLWVLKYNLYTYIFIILFSCFLATFGKKMRQRECMLTGLFMYALLYFMLMFADNLCVKFLAIPAFISAGGAAFFHVSYNEAMSFAMGERAKAAFVHFLNGLTFFSSTVLPLLVSVLIGNVANLAGYTITFGIVAAILICAMAVSFHISFPHIRKRKTYFANVLIESYKNKTVAAANFGELARGVREGAVSFALPVLLYITSGSIITVGLYVSLTALIQDMSLLHVRSRIRPNNLTGIMAIAVIVMLAAVSVFSFGVSTMAIFAYGIICAFVWGHFHEPVSKCYYFAAKQIQSGAQNFVEMLCVRELYLNAGKVLGVLIFMLLYSSYTKIVFAILIVNVLQIGSWLLYAVCAESMGDSDSAPNIAPSESADKDKADGTSEAENTKEDKEPAEPKNNQEHSESADKNSPESGENENAGKFKTVENIDFWE